MLCWGKGTGILLLLLRVSAGGSSYQAAAGPAVAECCTFQGYLEMVVAAAASFPAVLLLLRLLDLGCLLVLRLDLCGCCIGPDEALTIWDPSVACPIPACLEGLCSRRPCAHSLCRQRRNPGECRGSWSSLACLSVYCARRRAACWSCLVIVLCRAHLLLLGPFRCSQKSWPHCSCRCWLSLLTVGCPSCAWWRSSRDGKWSYKFPWMTCLPINFNFLPHLLLQSAEDEVNAFSPWHGVGDPLHLILAGRTVIAGVAYVAGRQRSGYGLPCLLADLVLVETTTVNQIAAELTVPDVQGFGLCALASGVSSMPKLLANLVSKASQSVK